MSDSRLVESWTWFAFASLTFVWRFISRAIRLGGWRNFELEDLFMALTFAFYTNVIVLVNVQTQHPRTNILPPTGTAGMSQAEINDRIYGAKITFTIEESMIMTQWGCKVCMCLLYHKLTTGLGLQRQIKFLIGYVVFGWLVTEIFFFGIWCRPFLNYFRVFEDNDPQCETSQHHLIMSFAFNISSDFMMLYFSIPLLLKSRMPWKQKAIITGIFSLGVFVMISAILNRYYCFAHPESILWIFWYVREASTAVIVTNVPHCYSLLRKILHLEAFGSLASGIRRTRETHDTTGIATNTELKRRRPSKHDVRLNDGETESTENFAAKQPSPLKIWQTNEYGVNESDASQEQWDENEARSRWLSTCTMLYDADYEHAGLLRTLQTSKA
ncbi:hypothetical protein V495_08777 [Pseudogymnoascus sp. VKM F-4514 (FW-929)]|nr:hypothetical protein V495_08777 [Pseudogymnoascus sp. VKM F-4514 (FW-929)]KFY51586.1 hypothetical protein V497_09012 [Pseudogymnoascus sp. VKM F-4516 (FW-969)]